MKDNALHILAKALERAGNIEFAYVFGSRAKEKVFPQSDIDIAAYMKPDSLNLDNELSLHAALARDLGADNIDLLILNRARNLILLDEIVRHGKVVFDGNLSLRRDFEFRVLHDAIDFKYQRKVFAGR